MPAILDSIVASVSDSTGVIAASTGYISEHYGTSGIIAVCLVVAAFVVVLVSKIIRLAMSALIYLALPAVGLAFLGSIILPYSFALLLPVTAVACSVFFLFKS